MASQRSDDPRLGGSPDEPVSEPPEPSAPAEPTPESDPEFDPGPPFERPDADEQSTILAPDPFEPVLPDPAGGPDAGALE